MDNTEQTTGAPDDETKLRVPDDFPRPTSAGAVGGAQPNFPATEYKGHLFAPPGTPPELWARWNRCEDFAAMYADKSLTSKAGKRAHMTEVEILDQSLPRLIATGWTSEPEARWVIRRVAQILHWPIPPAALEPGSADASA